MASQTVVLSQPAPLSVAPAASRKIALLGFGTVGSSVARILSSGAVPGLELTHVFNRNVLRKRVPWVDSSVCWTEDADAALNSEADVVVEVVGGVEPARAWVQAALEAGKSVVTANKQLIARFGPELSAIAAENGCQLLFGASVAGGVPVITAVERGLAGDELQSVCGILNGTCNYILSKMETGQPFALTLKQAQELGYAEADPTDDVAGYDTRAKLVILARVALGAEIPVNAVACTAISHVQPIDFEYARELGCTIRQIGEAHVNGDDAFATVEPMLVRQASALARAQGCENVVITGGRLGGSTAFSGPGAGGDATAVAVVSDLLTLSQSPSSAPLRPARNFELATDCVAPYFLRFVVKDRPGIVASIAGVLARYHINVDAVFQKPGFDKSALPFVVTVEACSGAKLASALTEIAKSEFLVEAPLKLRIFAD
ncbi:MAG TPA: homoserine dehydrogenase [Terriglobales bacterium]|nr:homoserine dehydrogenase [Terriglobales bacterium]